MTRRLPPIGHWSAALVAVLVLVVGACSGAPGTGSPGGGTPAAGTPGGGAGGAGGRSLPPATGAPGAPSEGPGGTGGGAAAGDVCALLTREQVEDFTGFPLREAQAQGAAGCRWLLEAGSPQPDRHFVAIEVKQPGGRAEFDFFSALEKVPGIGDGAVKSGGNTDGTVWAVVGDSLVKLTYALPLTTPDADPIVLPLVELALNALP